MPKDPVQRRKSSVDDQTHKTIEVEQPKSDEPEKDLKSDSKQTIFYNTL